MDTDGTYQVSICYSYTFLMEMNYREVLAYKLWKKGSCLAKIDRMYPSSKTCSVCGAVNQSLKLSGRIYIYPECGYVIDRDYNAAVNIREEGKRILLTYLKAEKKAA